MVHRPEREVYLATNTFLRDVCATTSDEELDRVCKDMKNSLMDWTHQCVKVTDVAPVNVRKQALLAQSIALDAEAYSIDLLAMTKAEMIKEVALRSRIEPERTKCDSVLCVPTDSHVPHGSSPRGSRILVFSPSTQKDSSNTQTVTATNITGAGTTSTDVQMPDLSQVKFEEKWARAEYSNALKAPSTYPDADAGESLVSEQKPDKFYISANHTSLVKLIAEFKKISHTSELHALNQGRMGCVSSVIFHGSAIGLYECPVFGVCTAGAIGTVIMASMPKPNSLVSRPETTKTPVSPVTRQAIILARTNPFRLLARVPVRA